MENVEPIIVSTLDMDRISELLDTLPVLDKQLEQLEMELDRATIVAPNEMPGDVVTMNSTVTFKLLESGKTMEKTLVYPNEVKSEQDVSVFAPVGSALLGLSVGQKLKWPLPGGNTQTIEIVEISYQPERSGDFSL
ncbi:regulator of nucleoside diphosphate kinase [Vibrio proteolyticus]